MHAFCAGLMGADDFETSYRRLCEEDKATRPKEISNILDGVCADLDARASGSVQRSELRDSDLEARVTEALRLLDALRHGSV